MVVPIKSCHHVIYLVSKWLKATEMEDMFPLLLQNIGEGPGFFSISALIIS